MENSNQIQQEGFSAYQIGILCEDNPYTGPEADMWLLGWEDAREQYYATQEELYGHLWNNEDEMKEPEDYRDNPDYERNNNPYIDE